MTQTWLSTNQPDLNFENTAVGRMKKEIWEADEAKLRRLIHLPAGVARPAAERMLALWQEARRGTSAVD